MDSSEQNGDDTLYPAGDVEEGRQQADVIGIPELTTDEESRTVWFNTAQAADEAGWSRQYLHKLLSTDASRYILGARRKFRNRFMYPSEAIPWLIKLRSHSGRIFKNVQLWRSFAESMARGGKTLLDYDPKTGGYIFGSDLSDSDDVFVYLMTRMPEDIPLVKSSGRGSGSELDTDVLVRALREELTTFRRDFDRMVRKAVREEVFEMLTSRDTVVDENRIVNVHEAARMLGCPQSRVRHFIPVIPGRRGVYRLDDVLNALKTKRGGSEDDVSPIF